MASEQTRLEVSEWDGEYAGGKQPFGASVFPGVDKLLTAHVPAGGTVIDLGCGYGRDSIFLAKELQCKVTGVEPAVEGSKALADAAAAHGLPIKVICAFLEEFDFLSVACSSDMVLMDSVLSFIEASSQPVIVKSALQSLKPGGHLVIIGWPKADDKHWVARLIHEARTGAVVTKDAEELVSHATFDGELTEMKWHVTVAKAAAEQ